MRLFGLIIVLSFFLSSAAANLPVHVGHAQGPLLSAEKQYVSAPRVNISLYVMSRCPDARNCENIFEQASDRFFLVLQSQGLTDKIDLELNYIAHVNHSDPLGVTCKHGALECLGNAHDLCLYHHLPFDQFYAALSCQNYRTPFPGDIGRVDYTRQCAEVVGVDWWESGVGECIQGKKAKKDDGKREQMKLGKEGHRLLLENVERTERLGPLKSCTIDIQSTIQGKARRCVVDGGVWSGCDDGHTAADFIRVIEEEWKHLQATLITTA